jgi:hypothetical protein
MREVIMQMIRLLSALFLTVDIALCMIVLLG